MTPVLACLVCAPPLDTLLTGGARAGVAALALVVVAVLGAIAVGARRVWREDERVAPVTVDAAEAPR